MGNNKNNKTISKKDNFISIKQKSERTMSLLMGRVEQLFSGHGADLHASNTHVDTRTRSDSRYNLYAYVTYFQKLNNLQKDKHNTNIWLNTLKYPPPPHVTQAS